MKNLRHIPSVLATLIASAAPLQGSMELFDIDVGTASAANLRSVTWGPRVGQASGSWGVASESYLGFTLTALLDGSEAAELSYDAASARTLGVKALGTDSTISYRTFAPVGREAIRLSLPGKDAPVGAIEGAEGAFAGIRHVALDRLNNGSGNIVTISGFAADPQASWAISPFSTPPLLSYDPVLRRLSFETFNEVDWSGFGLLEFANLNATLSPTGVALVFGNERLNNNNSYGLVGWQYAVGGAVQPRQAYYVSPSGDDDNLGTSPEVAFRSLQRAAVGAQPGDLFIIHGGTYRETVTLTQSGEPERPITFAAADGERVIIDGADPVDPAWVQLGGGIWKTTINANAQIEAVFFNGQMMMEARWPDISWEDNWNADKKWALTGEGSDMGLVYSDALADSGIDLTGGLVYIKLTKGNSCFSRPIAAHALGAAAFSWDASGVEGRAWSEDAMAARIATFGFVNNRFFVVAKGALDAPGEWWHDVAAGELFFIPPDGANPALHEVTYKARVAAFTGSGISDIVLEGLEMRASNLELLNADRITVRECRFLYSSTPREFWDESTFMDTHRPVYIRGHDNLIEKCHISWTIDSPMELAGTGNHVVNCVIHDFNLHGRHPGPALRLRGLAGVPAASQLPNTARNNTVYNAGGVGLYAQGRWAAEISHNHVFNAGIYTVDVASVYIPNGFEMRGSTVSYNWLHDVDGIGFRVDIEGRDMAFHHNLVWNARNGAKTQGYWLEVYNNTLVVNNPAYPLMIVFEPDAAPEERALWRVRNNAAYRFIDRKSLRASYAENPRPTTIELATVPGSIDYNVVIPADAEATLFVDPENFDFRPLPGGPLDRTGVLVPGVAERTDAQPPSVGALEAEAELLWHPGADWRPDRWKVPATPREATHLATVLLQASIAGPQINYMDIHVGDGGVERPINWNNRSGGGSWGVSSESFLGFMLTALVNGIEAGLLSWTNNSRTLGVDGSPANVGNVASINRNADGSYIEAIRLQLPAEGAAVGIAEGNAAGADSSTPAAFAGIRQIAFDRLTLGSGSHVTISGFVEDPQASWAVPPGIDAEIHYDSGILRFTTGAAATGWADFGLLELANLNATLSGSGVPLLFSNDKAGNNAYGLVGWRYATTGLQIPVALDIGLSAAGAVYLWVDGPSGADYLIQVSTDLQQWDDLELVSPPTLPFIWTDAEAGADGPRFYRVLSFAF